MVTSPTTITPVTTRTTITTTPSSSPQSADAPTRNPNILDRIRDIVFGLVATTVTGIMTQGFGGNPANVAPILTPARKDDSGRPPFIPIRPPNAKDPGDRNRPTQSETVYFDGHVLNISLPVNEDDRNQFGDQTELEEEVGQVVNEVLMDAFQPDENDVPHLKVIVRENGDNIVIEAEAEENQVINGQQVTNFNENSRPNARPIIIPTSEIRPGDNEGRPILSNTRPNIPNRPNNRRPLLPGFGPNNRPEVRPNNNRPIVSTRIPNQNSPFNVLETQNNQGQPTFNIYNQPSDAQNPNEIPGQQQPTFNVNLPISTTNIEPRIPSNGGGTRENPLRFEPSDAVTDSNQVSTPQTIPLNTPQANEIEETDDNQTEETLTQDFPEFISAVSEEENQLFDNRLNNILSRSSADIVEATVVEDFDYARRVRESNSRTNAAIGIATISSITIGIISLLIFGLLIFLAIARRRRRQSEYDTTTATTTPSQSRTTVTPSVLADTPSVSYLDDFGHGAPSSLESQGPNPVVPLDGHQTIVASYNDFMSDPNKGNGLAQSMPSPPLAQSGQVPKTKDLPDHDDYLFARKTDYYQV